MAFGTVARTVGQVGAAIPHRGLARIWLERLAVEEQELPPAEGAADVERERHVVRLGLVLHRRKRLQMRKEVAHVVKSHTLIGRKGKRRKKMRAVRRSALHHGGDEIRLAPLADARVRVWRN